MSESMVALRQRLAVQVVHWTTAAKRLQNLDELASPAAWSSMESYLGMAVRQHLTSVVTQLIHDGAALLAALDMASSRDDLNDLRRRQMAFRSRYLQVETTLDFYADAINTRTSGTVAGLLRACDTLAHRSMAQLLDQIGKPTPSALTYLDKGLGASILKAGLRLWDRTSLSPVAAIKITRHNLYRPTALIHEAGHQVAHITGWNEDLASALATGLSNTPNTPDDVKDAWSSWASEIAADAFAFVHTGYAAVAALYDVLDSGPAMVFRHIPGDPHPVSYIRVLLGVEMCRQAYGAGPWNDLGHAWTQLYPVDTAPAETASLLMASIQLLPQVVDVILRQPMRCFGSRPLVALINPERVKPETLSAMEKKLGGALYTSMHWVWTEQLRLLALTGLRKAIASDQMKDETSLLQDQWMLRLGGALQAA